MKEVVAVPERNSGWRSTFSRKRMLVLTPRMWNSYSARCIFWMACRYVPDRTITCDPIKHFHLLANMPPDSDNSAYS